MAPPSSRRSGHSRRAQYGQFTGYVLAALGALIGAILLLVSLVSPSSFSGLRGAAAEAVTPPGQATASVRDESQSLIESIQGYLAAGSQNSTLRREVELARIRLAEAEALKGENERLRALLEIHEANEPPVAVARLVGSTSASTRRFAYIAAGSNDGVRPGMPVRAPRGFVGRVLEVSGNTARILLLTDSESVVPVRRSQDNIAAFAEGRGDGLINIRLINLGVNPLKVGDIFVTSGAGGFFRPGVAVAIVDQITDDGGVARIISDPAATDFVSVERIWEQEAIQAARIPIEDELGASDSEE